MNINGKILSPLISFDMLFDTSMGFVNFVKKYCTDKRFDMNKIKSMSDREILSLTYSRKNANPLSILPIDSTVDINECLLLFFLKYYDKVLQLSPFTDFGYVAILMGSNRFDGINPYILVRNENEIKKVQSVKDLKNMKIVTLENINGIDFDPYYILSYNDLLDRNGKFIYEGKNIYLSSHEFNIEYLNRGDLNILKNSGITTIDIWRKDRFQHE